MFVISLYCYFDMLVIFVFCNLFFVMFACYFRPSVSGACAGSSGSRPQFRRAPGPFCYSCSISCSFSCLLFLTSCSSFPVGTFLLYVLIIYIYIYIYIYMRAYYNLSLSIYIYIYHVYVYIYIYIYIEREREREIVPKYARACSPREMTTRKTSKTFQVHSSYMCIICTHIHISLSIYIYMYRYT